MPSADLQEAFDDHGGITAARKDEGEPELVLAEMGAIRLGFDG